MLNIRIGGVPEHFNLPWHLAHEQGLFEKHGLSLDWEDFHGGTGAMTHALRTGSLDFAVLLTEGILADIANGNPSKIVRVFVESKLTWGIHTRFDSPHHTVEAFYNPVYAISRKGSGSHLMAVLDAEQRGINIQDMRYMEVGSLQGALDAFKERKVDLFLWEKYTTAPYCREDALRCIDTILTPWPCFMLAVRPDYYDENQTKLEKFLDEFFHFAQACKTATDTLSEITDRYTFVDTHAQEWLEEVQWGNGRNIAAQEVVDTLQTLQKLAIVTDDALQKNPKRYLIST